MITSQANTDAEIIDLLQAGFGLCCIAPGEKNPTQVGWQLNPVRDLAQLHGCTQIGIVCGPVSGNVVCIDLDGIDLQFAASLLPTTAMQDSRPGREGGHLWYRITDTVFADAVLPGVGSATRFAMDQGKMARFPGSRNLRSKSDKNIGVEIKGAGTQATVPPSTTKSGPRVWAGGSRGAPASVSYGDLVKAVESLASAIGWQAPKQKETVKSSSPFMGLSMRDYEIHAWAQGAKNGDKYKDLWNNLEATSEDDAALIAMLHFFTRDAVQIERMWMSSPCGSRSKTQDRADYRQRTIAFAMGGGK